MVTVVLTRLDLPDPQSHVADHGHVSAVAGCSALELVASFVAAVGHQLRVAHDLSVPTAERARLPPGLPIVMADGDRDADDQTCGCVPSRQKFGNVGTRKVRGPHAGRPDRRPRPNCGTPCRELAVAQLI